MASSEFQLGGKALSDKRAQLLSGIASAYYHDGLNQSEIAERFDVTRSAISRYLTDAREAGIVRIEVRTVTDINHELSDKLSALNPATRVHVLNTEGQSEETRQSTLSRYTADITYALFQNNTHFGLPIGKIIADVVESLCNRNAVNLNVIQMCGSTGDGNESHDSHALVRKLSNAYECIGTFLPAPFFVDSGLVKKAIGNNISIRTCSERARKVDVVIVGLGTIDPKMSTLVKEQHVPSRVYRQLKELTACGEVGGYMLDRIGGEVEHASYNPIMALSFKEFLTLPSRIGVCDGLHKAQIAKAAIAGGVLTDLVIPSQLASAMLD